MSIIVRAGDAAASSSKNIFGKINQIWANLKFGRNLDKIKARFGQKGLLDLSTIEAKFGQR